MQPDLRSVLLLPPVVAAESTAGSSSSGCESMPRFAASCQPDTAPNAQSVSSPRLYLSPSPPLKALVTILKKPFSPLQHDE